MVILLPLIGRNFIMIIIISSIRAIQTCYKYYKTKSFLCMRGLT
jgi:hypothetical protein